MALKNKLNCAAFGLRLNSLRAAEGAHEDLFSFTFYYLTRRLAHALAENRQLKSLAFRLHRRERARDGKVENI